MYIDSEKELRELYAFPKGRTRDKQLETLEEHSTNFINHSPFVVISTHGLTGLVDSSPRGGKPGFAKILNERCIVIPDAKGNNRLDSLVNIIETGNIGCLFLIPGVNETLRVNGIACVSTNSEYLNLFSGERNPPKACIEITISEVFLHCAKALMRSKLWSSESHIERSALPTMGEMIKGQLALIEEPESQEDMVRRYERDL